MADFIDYSRIGAPSYGKEISGLGDDIFEAVKFRAQRDEAARKQTEDERHARELEQYNRSIAFSTNRRLDEAEKRDQEKFANDKNDRALKGVHEYMGALGRDDGSAPAVAAAYGLPVTVTNPFPKPEAPSGVAPQPPGPEPQPSFVGPIQTLEQARQSALQRATAAGAAAAAVPSGAPTQPPPFAPGAPGPSDGLTSPDADAARARLIEQEGEKKVLGQLRQTNDYQTKLGAYNEEAGSFPQRQADFLKKEQDYPVQQRNWDEHAVHEVTLPNGQKFTATVAEARYAARSKDAQDMRDALMPQLQVELAAARTSMPTAEGRAIAEAEVQRKINLANEVTSAVFAGAAKPADAFKAYQTAVAANQKQAFEGGQTALKIQAHHEDVKTMADRPQMSLSLQGQKLGLSNRRGQAIEEFAFFHPDSAGIQDRRRHAEDAQDERRDALTKHNSALDVTAGAEFAKAAQDAGVLHRRGLRPLPRTPSAANIPPGDVVRDGRRRTDGRREAPHRHRGGCPQSPAGEGPLHAAGAAGRKIRPLDSEAVVPAPARGLLRRQTKTAPSKAARQARAWKFQPLYRKRAAHFDKQRRQQSRSLYQEINNGNPGIKARWTT